MKRLDRITKSLDMSLGKLQEIVKDREASVNGISELDMIYRLIDNKGWKCTSRYDILYNGDIWRKILV